MTGAAPTQRTWSPGVVHTVLALGGFAIGTTEFATMSLLPAFSKGMGVDAPTGGHVISAYALGVVVGAPLFAVLGAKLSRRNLLVILMGWFALGNALSAFAPSFGALLALRFVTGLPHGAYFGVAALVAAGLVPEARRTVAIGRVLTGLAVATIVGVPLANLVGQWLGWRWGFGVVAALAALTVALVMVVVAADRPDKDASPLRELGALRKAQVWLTLAIGAVGFGGMFAVYTYLTATLSAVTHASAYAVPLVLAVFGVGMTVGNFVIPRFADRALMPVAGGLLAFSAVALAIYPFAATHLWSITIVVAAIGIGGALGAVLQTRLMDVAGDAQSLAAALNHSAFNTANALGPWLGGLAITAGYGLTSTGWVGCGLALGGLAIWAVALLVERSGTSRSD
ncbi:MFS transporter [uncultured Sphingomonas sp.]|uniref:MFS transporter n=1 Tax=uncultured Sphingomonas sp. TaxID=158754 RepID=UPI0035CA10ED